MSLEPVRSHLGLFLLILAGAGIRAAPETIDVGSRKQLFVDDRFIESSDRVRLTMNPPWQDRRILLEPDQDWEGPGQGGSIGLYSSVLKENGKIRIWYDQRQYGEDRFPDVPRVCYAESEDGLAFVKPRLGLHETRGSSRNNTDQVYILLAQAFWHWKPRPPVSGLGPSSMDVRLLVSRDGKRFRRVGERKPFLRMGPPGSFDSARVWARPHPVRMGDEIWIYYNGSNRDHDRQLDSESTSHRTGISRAVMRLDGFVSVDAPYGGGRFITPPIRFSGSRLELNLDTGGGGQALVEILDESGRSVPGFSRDEALPLNGNSVRLPVRWRGDPNLEKLSGQPVRLRFHLQDCKLYAFQFKEIGETVERTMIGHLTSNEQ